MVGAAAVGAAVADAAVADAAVVGAAVADAAAVGAADAHRLVGHNPKSARRAPITAIREPCLYMAGCYMNRQGRTWRVDSENSYTGLWRRPSEELPGPRV